MSNRFMNEVRTYSQDRALFKKLGLEPFLFYDQNAGSPEHFVGKVKVQHTKRATVKIWVKCLPSQFYRFVVEDDEGRIYLIETGSGTLSDFWPTAEAVAKNMVVISRLS